MITIIIADDEKLIRAGIKKMLLESLDVPLDIIEAKNGAEVLDICKEVYPDLLITDIKMPVMDGIELMHAVSKMKRKPGIIVLSGFDDFTYAKEAINCGVISYILKPIDKKELISTVTQAIAEARKKEQLRNEEIIKKMAEYGHFDSSISKVTEKFQGGLCCITISGSKCGSIVPQILPIENYYVLEQKNDFLSIVVPKDSICTLQKSQEIRNYSVGISVISDTLTSLRSLRSQAYSSLLQSFFAENDGTRATGLFFFKMESMIADFSAIDSIYERVMSRLDISTAEEVSQGLETLFDFKNVAQEKKGSMLYYLYNKITMNLFRRYPGYSETDMYLYLKGLMIENIWQFENLNEWLSCVNDYAVYLSTILQQGTIEYPFIAEALEYIRKNFTKNINMAMIANHVSTNYTYFSEKFKEHTGCNFNDYLKRIRIEEAQRLLAKGCYKVYEVAQRSGFGDVKYFMKTFKEATGMSPGEYKKNQETSFLGSQE